MITLTVSECQSPTRIDVLLAQKFPEYSRNFFKNLIKEEKITCNNATVTKASALVADGDIITITSFEPEPRSVTTEHYKNFFRDHLVFESPDFCVINKPAGLSVHPPSKKSQDVALSDLVVEHYPECRTVGDPERPGIVHRLDKDTTGLLIIARTEKAFEKIKKLFQDREIQKTYRAFVKGHPEKQGTISLAIQRHPVNKCRMMGTRNAGRPAQTDYEVERYFDDYTLIKAQPKTGRTHQIRVHMSSIGHPIIGDPLYGYPSKAIKRQALHASELDFTFNNTPYHFSAPLPDDMQRLLA